MTTRKELLGHVRAAMKDADEVSGHERPDCGLTDDGYTELAFAAIEAVYKAIGDHQLAVMIGDTGKRERVVVDETKADSDEIELLQDGDQE
jgi:hypothetical protein